MVDPSEVRSLSAFNFALKFCKRKEAPDHGKDKDALKVATKRGYGAILELYENDSQYRARMTEQGSKEDGTHRRHEEANIDRVHHATVTKITV